jgi:PAS domain S-box-containing protein
MTPPSNPAAADPAANAIFWIDPEGRILDASDGACRALGYDRETLLTLSVRDVDPEFPADRWPDHWRELRQAKMLHFRTAHRRRDGSPVPVEVTAHHVELAGREYNCALVRAITPQRQTETALRESEERLALALAVSGQGLYDLDIATGRTVFSDEYARMLGHEPSELELTPAVWASWLHPEDRERISRLFEDCVTGERSDYRAEFRLRARSGDWLWVLSAGKVVRRDATGRPLRMIGTHLDITERKRAEAVLLESEERFTKAFRASPAPMALSEIETGRFLDVNQQVLAMLNRTQEEMIGRTSTELGVWADPGTREQLIARLRADGFFREIPVRLRTRTGEIREVLFSAERIRIGARDVMLSLIYDITERKRVEEALRASEARFRDLSTMASDWFWEQDDQFRFTYFSTGGARSGLERRGIDQSQLLDKTRWELPISLMPEQWAAHRALLEAHQPFRDFEYRILSTSGADLWFSVNGQPLFDGSGRFVGYRGTGRDITERKRVEERLLFMNALLSAQYAASMEGMLVVGEQGKILSSNRRFAEIWGIPEPILAKSSDEQALRYVLDKLSDPQEFLGRVQYLYARPDLESQEEIALKDGRVIDRYSCPMVGSDGKHYGRIWFFRDITDRKRAEQRLLESERKYRELVENANSIILRWNPEGEITFINEFGLKFFGYSAEELTGRHVVGTIVPPDESTGRDLRPLMDDICLHPERFERNVNENLRRDGERVWVAWTNKAVLDDRGQVVEVFSVGSDITDRKRTEEALRTSEAFYRSIFENSLFGIGISGPGMKLIQVNPAFCRMLEYDGDELVGKLGIGDVTHPDDMPASREAMSRLAGGEINDFIIEKRYVTKSRKTIDAITYVKAIRDRAGAHQGSSATILDITDRKRAEEELERHRDHLEELVAERTAELRQAMEQLVQSEKLAALGHLVAGVAHELNTPLGNARTVASALGEHLREFSAAVESGALRRSQLENFLHRGREAVELLERNTARAADLIGHFKQVAVDQASTRRRRFDLRRTVEEVLATLRPMFKRTAHRIELDIPAELALDSYPGPLEQVLANLVGNSLAHGFAGIEAGVIRLSAASLGPDRIQLDYTDNGVGIPQPMLKRIFEPFFTTKLGHGGSGLGLYIVYNLVTSVLGGTIEGRSPAGQGACFTLVLPRIGPGQHTEETSPCTMT